MQWRTRGAAPPPTRATSPREAEGGGHPWGEALLTLHLLAFPFLRPDTVAYLGGSSPVAPPWEFQAGHCSPFNIQN